jgi:5'-3' exonuclease
VIIVMGIPKFFRWLSERYPKINQRYGSLPNPETVQRHFNDPTLDPSQYYAARPPDPLALCNLPPEIDRLYIDMNGILHGCSHNNVTSQSEDDTSDEFASVTSSLSVAEIFRNVEYYLDRVVADLAKPKQLVYMAVDGVAPRAKLNQQRSRRYRSGQEGEIEQTVYQAHLTAINNERIKEASSQNAFPGHMDHPDTVVGAPSNDAMEDGPSLVREVQPGRFSGKFVAHSSGARSSPPPGVHKDDDDDEEDWMSQPFHSHLITPGTAFMEAVSDRILKFVQTKLETDPKWQHLTIVFSGPDVPGEGEHKIMEFIRHQKDVADPNTRHCIMGQDGDLIILGLVTHEPNLVLLRERVDFGGNAVETGVYGYVHNPNFEFLHLNILRDYLAYDLETSDVLASSPFDLENTIDDFCFMTFLIGNDFLPHL